MAPGQDSKTIRSNAILIACAPDMLDALFAVWPSLEAPERAVFLSAVDPLIKAGIFRFDPY